ncbi:hypothetical protein MXB_5708, partial [Myxobolus squamalis]
SFISIIKNEFLYFAEKASEIRENSSGIQYRQEKFTVPKIKQEYLIWKNRNQQAHFILEVFGDWKVLEGLETLQFHINQMQRKKNIIDVHRMYLSVPPLDPLKWMMPSK